MLEQVSGVILGGFISKVMNDLGDIVKEKIIKAYKNRKDPTIESRIYQFTVDIICSITYNYKKDMDAIFNATEKLLNSIKLNKDFVETDIVSILKSIDTIGTEEDILRNFVKAFHNEIVKEENEDLYKDLSLKNSFGIKSDTSMLLHRTDEIREEISRMGQTFQSISENKIDSNKEENHEVISETKKYLDRWNSNMFLNNPNKRDDNPCVAIKLKEVYLDSQLPHYVWKDSKNIKTDLKDLLNKYIIENNEKMLLILGQPGIGKSTLITWITANYPNDNILVYEFTSSLKNLIWQEQYSNDNIVDKIIKELNLSYEKLENKVLILDGLDEIDITSSRTNMINDIHSSWESNILLKNTLLIITCRENYIQNIDKIRCPYITLQVWDEQQINSFCDIYREKAKIEISENTRHNLLKLKKVLGIPLWLYMTLVLNITIENEGSMVDIYDKIFSLNGGIYDKCIKNVKCDYSKHRISVIKEQLHELSRRIAIWMFENEPGETFIPLEEYYNIYKQLNKDYKKELEITENKNNFFDMFTQDNILIGNFFKLIKHCEGTATNQLYFVHRSIYQYFVAEAIYNSIEKASQEFTEETQKILAKDIVQYLKIGEIDDTIGDFLKLKILKLYQKFGEGKQKNFYEWLDNSICKMINVGMFYYTGESISKYKNIIKKEETCFVNLIKILHLLLNLCNKEFILQNANIEILRRYISLLSLKDEKHNLSRMYLKNINLKNVNLSCINMEKSYLNKANLRGTNFKKANLEKVYLKGVHLEETNLEEAYLEGAHLENAHLERAHLEGAYLNEAHLKGSRLQGAHLEGAHLENANLEGTHLEGTHLENAHLEGAHLEGAHLENAHLERVHLEGAHLENAHLEGATLAYAYLTYTRLEEAHLKGTHLEGATLAYTYLERAILKYTHLERATLKGVNLEGAILKGVNLEEAILKDINLKVISLKDTVIESINFKGTTLKNIHLEEAHLKGAHLEKAHLEEAHLEEAHLEKAHLEEAHLEKAHLEKAHLEEAHLERARLEGAHLEGADLSFANLSDVKLIMAHLEGADLRKAIFDPSILKDAILENTKISIERYDEIAASGIDINKIIRCP